jgi:TetR/AcrR family transcriptional repressor of nem operon
MKKSKQPVKANLRDDICHAALALFSDKGYSGTNMSEVADALNITRTPLYYYYKDKKSLYIEVIKQYLSDKREAYTDMAAESKDVFPWLRQHIEYACKIKSHSILFNAFKMEQFAFLAELNDETNRYVYSLKKRRIQRAIESQELPADTDIDLLLENIYTMSYGLIHILHDPIIGDSLNASPEKINKLIDVIVEEIKAVFGHK